MSILVGRHWFRMASEKARLGKLGRQFQSTGGIWKNQPALQCAITLPGRLRRRLRRRGRRGGRGSSISQVGQADSCRVPVVRFREGQQDVE